MSDNPAPPPSPGLDWDARGGSFHLPPGLVVWNEINGRWRHTAGGDRDAPGLELHARYDEQLHRYRVDRMSMWGRDVTTALIRTVPIQRYLRELVAAACERPDPESIMLFFDIDVLAYWYPDGGYDAVELEQRRDIERSERSISSVQTLRQVAAVYRLAELSNEPPARSVRLAFGLEARTATNWIRRARETGAFE